MKKYLVIPALLLIASLFSFKLAENWQKYTSQEGHFSISFPGKPEETMEDSKNDSGIPFKIHFVTYAPSDDELYMAGWIDMTTFYPKDGDMKQLLENSRDGAVKSMNATNVTTLETHLEGNPYIEFTFSAENIIGKDRIYFINKFQYSIITMFPIKKGMSPNADKFITSFKAM